MMDSRWRLISFFCSCGSQSACLDIGEKREEVRGTNHDLGDLGVGIDEGLLKHLCIWNVMSVSMSIMVVEGGITEKRTSLWACERA